MRKFHQYILEFHVSRQARDQYKFDETIYSYNGNVVFANFRAARVFAEKINARRDLVHFPEQAVTAGQVNAMALIDEILHMVVENYRRQVNPLAIQQALAYLEEKFEKKDVDATLRQFAIDFPNLDVYKGNLSLDEFLTGHSVRPDGEVIENRQLVLEEMLMLWLANMNPAYSRLAELFDDTKLTQHTIYLRMVDGLNGFFAGEPGFGSAGEDLVTLLRSPALKHPFSLTGQLEYIRKQWPEMLGGLLFLVLSSLDLVKEEQKPIFAFGGPGPAQVIEFTGQEFEPEQFSPDREWMPNLVLIAKNSYVWLDQLSKKYQQPITRLDQVPDEEMDEMARWGVTGLWLIGLWERSMASQRIKQLRGNPEAVASAYSLFSYDIAADLGGEEAYQVLRAQAWKRGIRLASDMVPNHMGIDSRWVIEHPDWFVSSDYSPFPSYTFNGPNLSWDNRVGIYLEDHYYNNSDAAVVFKRVDFWTGSEKFIYHGNDGTSMPWNDTAQLNYLLPQVREAVIQTILHVARKFSVIRFDAAMTLAKKHYHRLWFPEPGSGGDIPSRAEHGLTKPEFDEVFPNEFWREVVDRVAQEVPDTLLLAEAFWLMEGYFVRTLGMHRVYNSAFMNMLRDEKNQEYRLAIKNTLEFDPEILKRYVNFMNNPDEKTAVEQFGKGDKYFGICTMMATLPGLPMLGHGQIEGFTEKYGMEYRRAYWDEIPDGGLIDRHRHDIFPLLRKRYLFSEVQNFLLYDYYTPQGFVNEDVFAYSNRAGADRSLVVYHNKFASTRGWIKNSTGNLDKGQSDQENKVLRFQTLGDALGIHNDPLYFTIFRDQRSGLEFIRNSQELYQVGLYIELEAYSCHVFMDFREVQETPEGQYARISAYLMGGGVEDIVEAFTEMQLQAVHAPFKEIINAGMLNWLTEHRLAPAAETRYQHTLAQALAELETKSLALLHQIALVEEMNGEPEQVAAEIIAGVRSALELGGINDRVDLLAGKKAPAWVNFLLNGPDGKSPIENGETKVWNVLLAWVILVNLGKMVDPHLYAEQSRAWIDEWLLGKIARIALQESGLTKGDASHQVDLLRLLVNQGDWMQNCTKVNAAYRLASTWLQDRDVQRYLNVHRYQEILYFNKESFETMVWWLFTIAAVDAGTEISKSEAADEMEIVETTDVQGEVEEADQKIDLAACFQIVQKMLKAMEASGYQVEKLLEIMRRA